MEKFNPEDLKKLYVPLPGSHKGQNGKLMIIGGSHLFHGASLWALKVASRIVDMVFYSSTSQNNKLTETLKSKLYDFMAIDRDEIGDYIQESDAILLGPGLPREEGREKNEEPTRILTERLLKSYPNKKWIIDAGSLTEMDPEWLRLLNGNVIITPHKKEFEQLFQVKSTTQNSKVEDENVCEMAKEYNCIVLLKSQTDIICSSRDCRIVEGGNVGMTKGGTGDVLAGLAAALACKNDLFLAACAASFINKKAGDELYKRVGPFFNATDLTDEIPKVMNELIL